MTQSGHPKVIQLNRPFGTFQGSRLGGYTAAYRLGADMRRRELIGLIGTTALGFLRPGYAQTGTDLPLVGFLVPFKSDSEFAKARVAAIRKGLQEEHFVEGRNYSLAMRFAEGDFDLYPQLAKELGTLNPRVIVVAGYGPQIVHTVLPASR